MSTSDKAPDRKRRRFLAAAGGAGALGTLAALAAEPAAAAPVAAPVAPSGPSGYRETEHIRKYYRTARYW